MSRQSPLWATPDRQNLLLKLWVEYGNKCLLGHSVCPIRSHYLYLEPKTILVLKPLNIPRRDSSGNTLTDDKGKPVFLIVYSSKPYTLLEPKLARLYELKSETAIRGWLEDDRVQRQAEAKAERRQLHKTADRRYPISGQFSAVSKDIFFDEQPIYYLKGLGISGLTFKPFAKVKLSSSYFILYIDIGNTLSGLSKSRRRKAIRYGKPLPYRTQSQIADICKMAVKHHLAQS